MSELRLCRGRAAPGDAERGAVVIEFYYVAVVLFVLAFGMIEVSHMLSFNRKVSMSAQTLVDLVARLPDPQNATLSELENGVRLSLRPFDPSLKATVAFVQFDEDGDPDLLPGNGTFQLTVADDHPFTNEELLDEAEGLGLGNDSVAIGRVVATYKPLLLLPFLTNGFDIESTNHQRPRPSF